MKTLYISDLDGTLLRDDQRTSDFTNSVINGLISRGMLFTLATSRSEVSSSEATAGLDLKLPMIVYNGAAIAKPGGEIVYKKSFEKQAAERILKTLLGAGVCPIVYSFIGDTDKVSYIYDRSSRPQREFIDTKAGDRRLRPVNEIEPLFDGDIFYFTCIGDGHVLKPLCDMFSGEFHCLYEINRYSGAQWLEIMPKGVSKSAAAGILKEILNADRTVFFGDGINDIEMFLFADERYAVSNAIPELKRLATGIIGSNEADGVARFLAEKEKVL